MWQQLNNLNSKKFQCGHCGNHVASEWGYSYFFYDDEYGESYDQYIFICPHCNQPTYFPFEGQIPGVVPGNNVEHVPDNLHALYQEARNCVSVSSYTSAVLTCRKLLMNIAVEQGAAENQTFTTYVDYLSGNGYVPPTGKVWVDHIRLKGNYASHEIALMEKKDAEELISFIEMLLKTIYEFPAKVQSSESA